MKWQLVIVISIVSLFSIPAVFAEPTVELVMEKTTYSYGDKLVYTIKVNEITDDPAIIQIRDESGKGSSPIPISISKLETEVPSLYPFESEIFPIGKYFVEVEYSGATDKIEFNLIDSGRTVIPFWIKQLAIFWITEQISDISFADGIEYLIEEGIIVIPEVSSDNVSKDAKIPSWVKQNAQWWIEEQITDDEFAKAIQYLIKAGIIVIGGNSI